MNRFHYSWAKLSPQAPRAIIGGEATVGTDNAIISATVAIIISGTTSFSFDLPILDDTFEPDETFTVTLSEPIRGTAIDTPTATTTIAANDMTPSGMWVIRTTIPTVNEAESARYNVEYDGIPAEQGSTVFDPGHGWISIR